MFARAIASRPPVGPSGMLAQTVSRSMASSAGRVRMAPRLRRPPKDVMTVTEKAAARISYLLERRRSQDDGVQGVRIGIKARGCNGLSYTMDYATEKKKLDEEVNQHGVRVFVESSAVMHIVGTTMDFVEVRHACVVLPRALALLPYIDRGALAHVCRTILLRSSYSTTRTRKTRAAAASRLQQAIGKSLTRASISLIWVKRYYAHPPRRVMGARAVSSDLCCQSVLSSCIA
mmetsp:Transcript_22454/g.33481  ORF Transcript_22454/g.33481 Transcript_22454/m.33481 type:complete len:232 (-) Transcript_22454:319-1014(-)